MIHDIGMKTKHKLRNTNHLQYSDY